MIDPVTGIIWPSLLSCQKNLNPKSFSVVLSNGPYRERTDAKFEVMPDVVSRISKFQLAAFRFEIRADVFPKAHQLKRCFIGRYTPGCLRRSFDLWLPIIWSGYDIKVRRVGWITDLEGLHNNTIESGLRTRYVIQPVNSRTMLVAKPSRHPDDDPGLKTRRVSDHLAKLVKVGARKLVLDHHVAF